MLQRIHSFEIQTSPLKKIIGEHPHPEGIPIKLDLDTLIALRDPLLNYLKGLAINVIVHTIVLFHCYPPVIVISAHPPTPKGYALILILAFVLTTLNRIFNETEEHRTSIIPLEGLKGLCQHTELMMLNCIPQGL